jgi:type IV pilus assembly protein PilB
MNDKKDKQAAAKKLGQTLLSAGVVTKKELSSALSEQKRTGDKLGKILIDLGFATEMEIVYTLAINMGLEYIELQKITVGADAIKSVSLELAEKHLVLPIRVMDNRITLAMSDPFDIAALRDIGFAAGKSVYPVVSTLFEIRRAIRVYYYNAIPKRLGEILIETGAILPEQLNSCLEKQKAVKKKIGDIILWLNFTTETEIARALSLQLNIPHVDIALLGIQEDVLRLIDKEFALKHVIIPLSDTGLMLEIAMANPMDIDTIREVKSLANKDVEVVISTATDIEGAIRRHYPGIT